MYDTDSQDLIDFARRWVELGDAVTDHVAQVVTDPDCGSCWEEGSESGVNPPAIKMASDRLEGLNGELDEIFAAFLQRAGR